MRVAILCSGGRAARESYIANALQTGAQKMGWQAQTVSTADPHEYDLVAGYGWGPHQYTFEAFARANKPYVFVDLGFWDRKPKGNRLNGHHKVSVSAQQPTIERSSLELGQHKFDRLNTFPGAIEPWKREGKHIYIAPLSAKASKHYGYGAWVWETRIIERLRKHTSLPIVTAPKHGWGEIYIPGCVMLKPEDHHQAIRDSVGLVTYKSNNVIDAIAFGVPIYCEAGIGQCLSVKRPEDILSAPEVNEYTRRQFLAAASYMQWTPAEMSSGLMWRHLVDSGQISAIVE